MCQSKMIRFANDNDTQSVIKLWSMCFPGETEFRDYFFDNIYKPEQNLLFILEDKVCAMAQMMPYKMNINGDEVDVTYIYGACTHIDFRKQGIMAKLLNKSFEIDKKNGIYASILIPQEKWLFDFYAKFGYKPSLEISQTEIESKLNEKHLKVRNIVKSDIENMQKLYYENMWNSAYILRDNKQWEEQISMFTSLNGYAIAFENNDGEMIGYAFVWKYEDSFWAQEFVCNNGNENLCIASLQNMLDMKKCTVSGLQFENKTSLGCILTYGNSKIQSGYINLMLN